MVTWSVWHAVCWLLTYFLHVGQNGEMRLQKEKEKKNAFPECHQCVGDRTHTFKMKCQNITADLSPEIRLQARYCSYTLCRLFIALNYFFFCIQMFGFHKPKMYRSLDGCCICRAKSSSSRFTDSKRYEKDFRSCFGWGTRGLSGERFVFSVSFLHRLFNCLADWVKRDLEKSVTPACSWWNAGKSFPWEPRRTGTTWDWIALPILAVYTLNTQGHSV